MRISAVDPVEVYVHIPFCARKCAYCDFLSFPAEKDLQRQYVDALLREIRRAGRCPGQVCSSVFFGGGTPSLLPAEWIAGIMQELRKQFAVRQDAEITIEANPGTVDEEKLRLYREEGINRISFGCQSFHNEELKLLGRIHSVGQIRESIKLARKAGFENINLDLMSGLPGQTLQGWEDTLRQAVALHPEHISAYSLIIEEGTPFFLKYGESQTDDGSVPAERDRRAEYGGKPDGRLLLPDEETERRMYDRTAEILSEAGYQQYEISNYAREGSACRHNLGYWTGIPYYGFGLGASGCLPEHLYRLLRKEDEVSRDGVWVRYHNTENMTAYLSGSDYLETEKLEEKDREAEFMILGLRLTDGVEDAEFERRFRRSIDSVFGRILDTYMKAGFLIRENGRTRFSKAGISVSNRILAEFL